MERNELNSMIGGYVAGKAISGTICNNLQKYINETEEWISHHPEFDAINGPFSKFILSKDIDGGNNYINELVMEELVHYAQHQEKLSCYLGDLIDKVRVKYSPFYTRMQRTMPDEFSKMDVQRLCDVVGVPLLKTKEEFEKERQEKDTEKTILRLGVAICAILAIVVIVALLN